MRVVPVRIRRAGRRRLAARRAVGGVVVAADAAGQVGAPVEVRADHAGAGGQRQRRPAGVEVPVRVDVDVAHVLVVVVAFAHGSAAPPAPARRALALRGGLLGQVSSVLDAVTKSPRRFMAKLGVGLLDRGAAQMVDRRMRPIGDHGLRVPAARQCREPQHGRRQPERTVQEHAVPAARRSWAASASLHRAEVNHVTRRGVVLGSSLQRSRRRAACGRGRPECPRHGVVTSTSRPSS